MRSSLSRSCLLTSLLALLLAAPMATPAIAQDDPLDSLFGESQDSQPELPTEPEDLVKELIRRGQNNRAHTVLDELLTKTPKSLELRLLKARLHFRFGQLKASAALTAQCLKLEPRSPHVQALLGRLAERQGQLKTAQRHYRKAIEQDPTGVAGFESAVQLGRVLIDQNKRSEGEKILLRVLRQYEQSADLSADEFYYVGQACVVLDFCPEVKKLYRKPMYKYSQLMYDQALAKDDRHVWTLLAYGQAYSDKYNFADARKVLKIAVGINKTDPHIRVAMAVAMLSSYELGYRRFELARYHLNEALQVYPNMPEALVVMAQIAISDGQYKKALDLSKQGLQSNPLHVGLMAVRGALAVLQDRSAELDKDWAKLKKARPTCAEYFSTIADIIVTRFRYAEARDYAAKALDVDPGYYPALATYGLNLTRTGDSKKGVEILEKSQKQDPFNVYVWNTLKVFAKLNDPKEFSVHKSDHFELKVPVAEEASVPFILDLLERAWEELGSKYQAKPKKVYVEFFSKIEDFSARSIGLPFIGALGVCFGNTMTVLSAKEKRLGEHSWGRTLWHEYGHVVTLTRTKNRVPRWFTEGLSVYEESRGKPTWVREYDRTLMTARRGGYLLPISEFDAGFSKPRFGGQVMLSYYQGGLICEFIDRTWGFDRILQLLDAFGAGNSQANAIRKTFGFSQSEFDKRFLAFVDQYFAGYPQSILAPNNFANMMQGVVIRKERVALRDQVNLNPWNLKLRGRLARVYQVLGKDADAVTQANEIRKRVAQLAKVLGGYGAGSQQFKHAPHAVRGLSRRFLEMRSALGDAYLVLGMLELKARKAKAGRSYLKKALELGTGDSPLAHDTLGRLALQSDDYATAAKHFEAVARLVPPEAGIHRKLQVCYGRMGQEKKALSELIKICLLDSKDLKSRLAAGQALYEQKRWADLAQVLDDVMLLNPFVAEANFYLAEALRHTKRYKRAVKTYQIAILTNYGSREQCHLGQALCYERLKLNKEAVAAAKKALADDDSLTEAKDLIKRLSAEAK